jgi:hypothetical protein
MGTGLTAGCSAPLGYTAFFAAEPGARYLARRNDVASRCFRSSGGALAANRRIRRRGGAGDSASGRRDPVMTELANSR